MTNPTEEELPAGENSAAQEATSSGNDEQQRREFMSSVLAGTFGVAVGLIPAVTASLFLLHPLIRKGKAGSDEGDEGFVKLSTTLDSLATDGTPRLDKVLADKVDAWNKFLDQPIGAVYLRRMPDGPDGKPQVLAFNTRCPHLGCAVEYRAGEQDFFCPCHTSAFALDGVKKNAIPPRGLDDLEVKLDGNQIWVKFQNFRATTAEKIPV